MVGLVTWRVQSCYACERGVLCWRNGLGVRVAIPRILTRSLQRGWQDHVGFARAGGRMWSGPRASLREQRLLRKEMAPLARGIVPVIGTHGTAESGSSCRSPLPHISTSFRRAASWMAHVPATRSFVHDQTIPISRTGRTSSLNASISS